MQALSSGGSSFSISQHLLQLDNILQRIILAPAITNEIYYTYLYNNYPR